MGRHGRQKNDSMILSGKSRGAVMIVRNHGKGGLLKPTNKYSRMGLPVVDVLHDVTNIPTLES